MNCMELESLYHYQFTLKTELEIALVKVRIFPFSPLSFLV